MYKIISLLGLTFVVRKSDNAHIPVNEENNDYQEYLVWVAEGNTAEEQ